MNTLKGILEKNPRYYFKTEGDNLTVTPAVIESVREWLMQKRPNVKNDQIYTHDELTIDLFIDELLEEL